MAGVEVYLDVLFISAFLFALWLATWICQKLSIAPIVGQILVGILLGPQGIAFVPLFDSYENLNDIEDFCYSNNVTIPNDDYEAFFPDREKIVNFLFVLGNVGITFLIFESGLHINFDIIAKVGSSALLVAFCGTFLSFFVGIGLSYLYGIEPFPEGVAIGAVIAPTSVGIALKILNENNVLDSTFGQTIITAAFTDDIIALITLSLLVEIAGGNIKTNTFLRPIGLTLTFIIGSIILARKVFPYLIPRLLQYFTKSRDYFLLLIIFLVLAAFSYLGTFVGSHLLGSFFAGVSMSKVSRTSQVWDHFLARESEWLQTIFFGATVAFQIPVKELFVLRNFLQGFLLGVAAIAAKLISGFFLKHRWVIGLAMAGRGEFSFLVGEVLQTTEYKESGEKFLSKDIFGMAVWALLIAIFVSPIIFQYILRKEIGNNKPHGGSHYITPDGGQRAPDTMFGLRGLSIFSGQETLRSRWKIKIHTVGQSELLHDILAVFKTFRVNAQSFHRYNAEDYEFRVEIIEPAAEPTDLFFDFDIKKFVSRLKKALLDLLIADSEIIIERVTEASETINNVPLPTSFGSKEITISHLTTTI